MNSAATITYLGLLLKLGTDEMYMKMHEALHWGESAFYMEA